MAGHTPWREIKRKRAARKGIYRFRWMRNLRNGLNAYTKRQVDEMESYQSRRSQTDKATDF